MRKEIVYHGPEAANGKPRVLIARAIICLPVHRFASMLSQSQILEHGDEREVEAARDSWLAWLDETPRSVFLGYTDAYYAFVQDLRMGDWSPGAKAARKAH